METLKNEEVQVTPGMTFTYRKADIQGLTDPVHTTTAALGVAGATTVTTAVRLIQASPSASIAGQPFFFFLLSPPLPLQPFSGFVLARVGIAPVPW